MNVQPSPRSPFRILSLSGGGFQGLFSAIVLRDLEQALDAPLRERFDLIAGTSVGGVMALAIAAGVPMAEVVGIYTQDGPRIFSSRPAPRGRVSVARDALRYLRAAKYDGLHLRHVIERLTGAETRLSDLPVPVIVPTVRVRDGAPVLIGAHSHPDLRLVDLAMAAAAAPMMLPAVRIDGALHADGAIFSNVPDLIALHEAECRLGVAPERMRMLSIGTASAGVNLPEPASGNMGILGWVQGQRIWKTVLASQSQMATQLTADRLGAGYLRVDAPLSAPEAEEVWLDVASPMAVSILSRLGHEASRKILSDSAAQALLGVSA